MYNKTTRLYAINRLKSGITFCNKIHKEIGKACHYRTTSNKKASELYRHGMNMYSKILDNIHPILPYIIDKQHNKAELKDVSHYIKNNKLIKAITVNGYRHYVYHDRNRAICAISLSYPDILDIDIKIKNILNINLNDWKNMYANYQTPKASKQRIWVHTIKALRKHYSNSHHSNSSVHLIGHICIVGVKQNSLIDQIDTMVHYWQGAVDINGDIYYPIVHSKESHKKNRLYTPMDFLNTVLWQRKQLAKIAHDKLWKSTVTKFHKLAQTSKDSDPHISFGNLRPSSIHISAPFGSNFLNIYKGHQIPSDYGNNFSSSVEGIINWYRTEFAKSPKFQNEPVSSNYFKRAYGLNDNRTKKHAKSHIAPIHTNIITKSADSSYSSSIKQDIHKLAVDYGKHVAQKLEKELDKKYLK